MRTDKEFIHPLSVYDEFLNKVNSEEEVRTKKNKFIVLFLIASGLSIFYMIYDSLQIFQTLISKNDSFTIIEYELLYTVTHVIPIFATPFYGIFTDLYSVRHTYLVCFCWILLGHIVFTIGLKTGAFFIMFLGRIFVGCGYPIHATSFAFLSKWFIKIKDVYAYSFLSFGSRIGSFTVAYIVPTNYITGKKLLAYPMIVPTLVLLFFFVSVIVLYYFDHLIDKKIYSEKRQEIVIRGPKNSLFSSLNFDQTEKIGQFFQVFSFKNFHLFERNYWMLVFSTGMIFLTTFTFFNRLADLLIVRYSYSEEMAINISGAAYLITAILTPVFGFLVRIFEKRIKFLLMATTLNIVSHTFFTFSLDQNHHFIYLAILLKVITFSCVPPSHYSSFVILVPSNRIGRAYGFNSMVEYISITSGFFISTLLVKDTGSSDRHKYQKIDFFCILASLVSLYLYYRLKKLKI